MVKVSNHDTKPGFEEEPKTTVCVGSQTGLAVK